MAVENKADHKCVLKEWKDNIADFLNQVQYIGISHMMTNSVFLCLENQSDHNCARIDLYAVSVRPGAQKSFDKKLVKHRKCNIS